MAYNPAKSHLTYSVRDAYKDYKKDRRENGKEYELRSYKKYKEYIFEVFAEIFKDIVHKGWHFILPFGLGEFYLKVSDSFTGTRVIDWEKTAEKGEHVYHFNNHSFRKVYKLKWDTSYTTKFDNAKFYHFNILDGKKAYHKKYGVGAKAINERIMEAANDPMVNMPITYNKPIKTPQDLPDGEKH